MTESLPSGMQFSRFAVDDEPWCVWEWDLPERNLEFIEAISPDYFEHLAKVHIGQADGEDRRLAAVAIRLGYGQALEAFFALALATLQAPDCVPGWLSRYRLVQLHSLVRKVSAHEPVLTKLLLPEMSWDALANLVLCFRLESQERDRQVKDSYGTLWARLARDFSDEEQSHEYNCIKHGLRIRPGGFTLRVGQEEVPGVAASPDRMHPLGGSEFGCSMLKPEPIGQDRHHFRLRRTSRNWQLENLAHGLVLIASSIRNLTSFLRIVNGVEPATVQFSWPQDLAVFKEPWKRSVGVTSFNLDTTVANTDIRPLGQDEILSVYSQGPGPGGA